MFGLFQAMRRLAAAVNEMAQRFEAAVAEIDAHRAAPEPGQPAEANGRPRAKAKAV